MEEKLEELDKEQVEEQVEELVSYDDYEMVREVDDEEYVKKVNIFKRLFYIFVSPIKLIKNIDVYPNLIAPFALIAVMAIFVGLGTYATADLQLQSISETAETSQFQAMMQANRQIQTGGVTPTGDKVVAVIQSGLGFLIGSVALNLVAALLWFIICKIFKGETSFKKLYSMLLHISVLTALFQALTLGFNYLAQSTLNPLTLELFLPASMIGSIPQYILLNIGIPQFLGWAITVFGISEFNKFSMKKAAIITVCMAVASIACSVIITVVSQNILSNLSL